MDQDALVKTDITVELKVVRADGTEEVIGEYPVYMSAEEPSTEEPPGE